MATVGLIGDILSLRKESIAILIRGACLVGLV